jgi:branched-chain amino acid transport system substrate-binding protein
VICAAIPIRISAFAAPSGARMRARATTEARLHISARLYSFSAGWYLNKAGGVLGEPVRLILVDDYCRGDQAIAAARKLVEAGVVFVAGHPCSGAAIPASKIYEEAGILMISSTASNPKLTDEGGPNVFRMVGRDDLIGRIAGNWLADQWGDAQIAILHDGQAYGKGLADEVKSQLNGRGIHEVMYEAVAPGQLKYIDVLLKMKGAGIGLLF